MTEEKAPAIEREIGTYLLERYGATMRSHDLAEQLHVSPTAIRIGLCRGVDLPPPDRNLPGRGHRWLTVAVAAWLVARSDAAKSAPENLRSPVRGPGRPRMGVEVRHD